LHIGVGDTTAGRVTLEQAWNYIETNTQNDTDYFLYFSAGHYMAGRHYGGDVSSFWNISIHYMGEASTERVVLSTKGERDQGIVHSRLNRVSFSNLTIEDGSATVQSCNSASFERVTLSGTLLKCYA
jgi:hypothetical protein